MRATSMRRLVGGVAALMLVGTMLLTTAGSALAATTRFIYVGPDPGFILNPNTLSFTPVTVGGDSLSTIYVKNIDNQTLTHVVISIAKSQHGATVSGQILGPNASKCDGTIDPITCDFGNLRAGATRQFSIIVNAGVSSSALLATYTFNESNNPNGGNPQIDHATGTLAAGAATCDTAATFVPPGIAKTLDPSNGTNCATDPQHSVLLVPASADGSVISVDDTLVAVSCPTGFSCFGNQVNGNVNNGAPVSLRWSIFYSNEVLGNINPNKVAFVHTDSVGTVLAIIPAGNKGLCKNLSSTNCVESVVTTTAGTTWVIRTPSNGLIKGMN